MYEKHIGFIGLLETKVKENKAEKTASKFFRDGISITISPLILKEEFRLHEGQVVIELTWFLNLISSFIAGQHR